VLTAAFFGSGGYVTGTAWRPVLGLMGEGALLGALVAAAYCWLAGVGGRTASQPNR